MLGDVFSDYEDSENLIPPSNVEPPPPINCLLRKSREGRIGAIRESRADSVYIGQPDEFEDIHFSSANQHKDIASLDVFCPDKSLMTHHSSHPDNVASFSILSESHENSDPKRSNQFEKLLSPALSARASVPTSISSKIVQTNVLDFRSQINTEFNSTESLNSPSLATATNTTSDRTTRSGSDLFKSDSSIFREPLIPPRRRNVTSTSTNTTYEDHSSPVFLYCLSLSIQRLPSPIEKSDDVAFKVPDFSKVVTWQCRLRRTEENGAASISDAASVLADSFNDWMREYLTSESEESHSDYIRTPATLVAPKPSISNTRFSSSSSDYFVPRMIVPESTIESSELGTQSDILSKPMEQLIDPELVAPESASGNRASTSSSEYFLPWKSTATKRKLDMDSLEKRETVVRKASVQPEVTFNIVPPESELQDVVQNRASTSSSEYFIPVKKSAMRIAKSINRQVTVVDAIEMNDLAMASLKAVEHTTLSQEKSSGARGKPTASKETPSTQNPIKEAASQTEEKISITIPSAFESGLKSILHFRNGKPKENTSDAIQQELQELSSEPGLQITLRTGTFDTTDSQEKLKTPQKRKTVKDTGGTFEATSSGTPVRKAAVFNEEPSDVSTVVCKLEPESPGVNIEIGSSFTKSDFFGATASVKARVGRAVKVLGEDTLQPEEPAIELGNSTASSALWSADTEQLHQIEKGVNQSVNKLCSISRNDTSMSSVDFSGEEDGCGIYVYAKWNRDGYFYAGQIMKILRSGRFIIEFEDKKTATLLDHNVILSRLLPLGALVEVDINGQGEFKSDYIVSGHTEGTMPPSYLVKRITDNDVNQVSRFRVAIREEELEKLLVKGQVSRITQWACIYSMGTAGKVGNVSTPLSTLSNGSGHRILPSELASLKVLVQYMTPSSVSRKQSTIDINVTPELISVKSRGKRKVRSQKNMQIAPSAESCTTFKKASGVRPSCSKKNQKLQRRNRESLSSSFNRRDSQIWLAGRRIVTKASRVSRLLERKRAFSSSVSRTASSHPEPSGQRRKLVLEIKKVSETSSVVASLSPIKGNVVPRLSPSGFSIDSVRDPDLEAFKQMCRTCDFPIPHFDLFSRWVFVFTTGVQSAHSDNFHLTSNDSGARKQLSLSENPFFLRKLVDTSGGQNIDELTSDISTTGCLVDGRHIVLVAPAARRTVRYLQGLATLGRVPLVHPVWILDSCLLAAHKRPLVAPPKVVTQLVSMKINPSDLPLRLLRLAPRELYELPRGVDRITNREVLPTIFPPAFIKPDDIPPPKTLLELGGYTSSKVAAIVTKDLVRFGEGWLSILRHAMFTETSTELPVILSPEESLSRLQMNKTSKATSIFERAVDIVLVDQDRIPESIIAGIRNMGFVVVNKEFLIQSLINGKALDLKYATAWRN